MDVRHSAEQRALRDSATQIVDRLAPKAVGQLDDVERAAKLDTWECFAPVYLRRALLSAEVGGGIGPNLERVLRHAGVPGAA